MEHCTQEKEIRRLIRVIDGNGRKGLNDRVTILDTKMDGVTTTVDKIKLLIQWLIGTIIAATAVITSLIVLL
ncbi:MAG: hypothetical protein ACLFQA_00315 [Bacteroidales bacterium]